MKEHGTGMPADVLWGLELKRISYLCHCENNLIKLICYNISIIPFKTLSI